MKKKLNPPLGSQLAALFLVAGTAIGGGMLGLPLLTAQAGFWPTTLLYVFCWFFMASTGHLLMELTLSQKKESNIISIAGSTLGNWGKVIAWILYLYLFYSLTVAYLAGGGKLIHYALPDLAPILGPLLFFILFAPIVIFGAVWVGRINTLFVWGLFASFLIFIILGFKHINYAHLQRKDLSFCCAAMPILFTSFGFQGIVPTLTNYLNRDPKKIAIAIWVGSFLPLFVYVIWQMLILGVVPFPALCEAKILGETAVYPLKDFLQKPLLYTVGKWFAFFAIVTSFFGVTLGLMDFFRDGLKVQSTLKNRLFLGALVFILPLIFALLNPCLFLDALQYGGGIGCALLLGVLPILMAWSARYKKGWETTAPLFGGKPFLIILLLFVAIVLTLTFLY